MSRREYIQKFQELGYGLFVHFGLYSLMGKGEWYLKLNPHAEKKRYENLIRKFFVKENWAEQLVSVARRTGAKYIVLTARHHDGFSLYDTQGLNDYDAVHAACGRDLIKEFVSACKAADVVPFLYHTLSDWHSTKYRENFSAYIDYLVRSIDLLCKNYGSIGGFWFDGMWDKPKAEWQEDRIYQTIRKYQPEAIIVNNTGLSEQGKVGHKEIDCVTFERGKPCFTDTPDRPRGGEMCQVLNDHWGYAKDDINYKSIGELIENLVDCRSCGCNFLLNTGLLGNGSVNQTDECLLEEIGKWIRKNKSFVYEAKPSNIKAENAFILKGNGYYYAVIHNVPMSADPNVALSETIKTIRINAKIKSAYWLDSGKRIKVKGDSFSAEPFLYGTSLSVRIAKLELEN